MEHTNKIEFKGCISGEAVKFYAKNIRKMGFYVLLSVFLLLLPLIIIITLSVELWVILIGYGIFCFVTPLFLLIPKTKNEKNKLLPSRIYTDEEYIIAEGDNFEEYHLISDVVRVIDFGSFYYLSFPFGKKSDKFLCQKSLLTKGSLEDFEALFEGKIERRIK